MAKKKFIFETPDKGKTITTRHVSCAWSFTEKEQEKLRRSLAFDDMLEVEDRFPALKSAIEQLEMIYELIKDHDTKK